MHCNDKYSIRLKQFHLHAAHLHSLPFQVDVNLSLDLTYNMCIPVFYILTGLNLYTFCSVIVICHFNIELTEAGVMHEAGYVDSIWST